MGGLSGPVPAADSTNPRRRQLAISGTGPDYHPEPLVTWRADTAEAWGRFWDSPLVGVAINPDVPSMQRLFSYYDIWQRLYVQWAQQGDLTGVTVKGEEKVHPLLMSMLKVGEAAARLEERFGITPYLRAKLGIKVGEAVNTQEKLNRPARTRRGADPIDVEAEE